MSAPVAIEERQSPARADGLGAPPAEARVGLLVGDRLCAKCCFNLVNQTIVRESRYGLLLVRCPECGTPAAIQEYPLLGRWANRLAFVAGGLWLVSLLAFLTVNVVSLTGITVGISEELLGKYASDIARAFAAYNETNSPRPANAVVTTPWGTPVQCSPEWWEAQDHGALLAASGGWAGAVDWNALRMLAFPILVGLGFGMIWSVALPHARGFKRLIPAAAVLTIALIALGVHDSVPDNGGRWQWAYQGATHAAYGQLSWTTHWIPLSAWLVAIVTGLIIGRAVARRLIVIALPPRLRAPWSFLWLCDSMALPRPDRTRG